MILHIGDYIHQGPSLWAFVITGFLQTAATRSRMIELWKKLHFIHHRPQVRVELRSWQSDWEAQAEFLFRISDNWEPPKICVFAYSWGAGWGFLSLAKALEKRGLSIESAVLADPVYRHSLLGSWRTLLPSLFPLYIPRNVAKVRWYRQFQNWPRAGDLRAIDPKATFIESGIGLNRTHQHMDEAPEFLKACLEEAAAVLNPFGE